VREGIATLYTDSLSYREDDRMHRSTRTLRHYTGVRMAARQYVKDLERVDILVDAVDAKTAEGRERLFLGVYFQRYIMFHDSQQ
jgi:hypothetical protein